MDSHWPAIIVAIYCAMIHVVLSLDPRRAGIGCRILMAYIGVIGLDYWIGLLVIVGYGADVMKSG